MLCLPEMDERSLDSYTSRAVIETLSPALRAFLRTRFNRMMSAHSLSVRSNRRIDPYLTD